MNPAQLITHFDRISDAPDAVARLRRFILDLAVRGKLVDQNPNDEPVSELLKHIAAAMTQVAGGNAKPIIVRRVSGDVPFKIPDNWIWVELGDICSKTGSGSTPRGGKSVYQRDGVPFLRSQNVYDGGLRLDDVARITQETHEKMSGTAVQPGDLLLNITGGSIGRCCHVQSGLGQANVSQHVAIIRVPIDGIQRYLHWLILSPYFQSFVLSEQTGAGRGGLPKNRMDRIPVALPPEAEQQRITVKLDELMALCGRLEMALTEREGRRHRLATATLHRLNDSDNSEDFRSNAHFYLNHLSRLTERPNQILAIRQTILNLAVRGRLFPTSSPSTRPLPLREFATLQNGYAFKSEWFVRSGIRLLRNANVSHGFIRWDDVARVSENRALEFERFRLNEGDIVLSLDRPFIVSGTKVARVRPDDMPCLLLQRVGRFVVSLDRLSPDYLFLWLNSPHFTSQIDPGRSNGVPHISSKQVEDAELFVPSLPEQRRIVAAVAKLIAQCDQLESQLNIADTEKGRLLEAILNRALYDNRGASDSASVGMSYLSTQRPVLLEEVQ